MSDDDLYMVWSNEHMGWWKPGSRGYTKGVVQAGRFSREQALEICRRAIPTAAHIGVISEIPVRLLDVGEFLEGQILPSVIVSDET